MAVPLLSGCLRVQVTMGVSSKDLVTGHIVAASIPRDSKDQGPQLTVPASLAGKMRVQQYRQDGYVGSEAFFSNLTFGELGDLGATSEQAQGMFHLALQRSGDAVTFSGTVDLTDVAQGSDVQISMNFPAHVSTTNGTRDGDNGVTWKLPPGEKSSLAAEVSYADPHNRGFTGWLVLVALIALASAVGVGYLAYRNRDQSPRPGDPEPHDPGEAATTATDDDKEPAGR
ncbi:LppM family (lipo)protein [Speluncibacter jeojiensis]|uniref:LppM family (lipo)protein n=1 Tax=Speluncibacter jeojiensis TaxID=2710754 RepID=UPI00240EE58A|nr:DUF3153 domain-containing protein [Rhodococcus sp. D2-41]